ncbi:MAG: prenyltransferase/squalene oxidase repeat-containing protein [Phycisphaerae bacterium]
MPYRRTGWTILLAVAVALAGRPPTVAAARPDRVTARTERAIEDGLAFLARTQARNGAWRSRTRYGVYPCAITSLAGLALMAGGNTPSEGPYADNVRRAVDFILKCANRNGLIAVMGEEQRPMYGHGFGMLFLAQAYGAEQDAELQRDLYRVLSRAVMLTARSQSPDGGWLYTPDAGSDEGSVTVTQIQALRACRNAGIKVPKATIERAVDYVARCANDDGGISYSLRNLGRSRPAITAAAVAVLYNAGKYDSPIALRALDYVRQHIEGGGTGSFRGHRCYALLYAAQAMYLSSDANWQWFVSKYRDELLDQQHDDGSWPGDNVGEVYGTAMTLLVLELPYRYLPILQR